MASPPWPLQGNGVSATYPLHCHCGLVKYTATLSPPMFASQTQEGKPERWSAVECNCSHCERVGAINVHPFIKDVVFTQGKEHMVEYRSGAGNNPHWNCGKCGCFLVTDLTYLQKMVGEPEPRYALNVSSLSHDGDL